MQQTGGRNWVITDRLTLAIARLQVMHRPARVDEAIQLVENYIERLAKQRTDELKAEWTSIHAELQSVADQLATPDGAPESRSAE